MISLDSELRNLQAMVSVEGGKKKKKKKVYTTAKKKKHIHKRVKCMPLSYYHAEKDGSVKRIRKLCESK